MKKALFVNPNFYYTILKSSRKIVKTHCRNTILLPISVGSTIIVHNGKDYLKVYVSNNIIGHKLGEFSISRRRYFFKKGKIKKKSKK